MILRFKNVLHEMLTKIKSLQTQQEISDALKVIEQAINSSTVSIDKVQPPAVDSSREGHNTKCGIKANTKRLKIARELSEEQQNKEIKRKTKKKKEENPREKEKNLFREERGTALEEKKRKLALCHCDEPECQN